MHASSKTLGDLGWPQLVEHLVRRSHTERGAEALRALEPFDEPDEARERIALIGEARALNERAAPLGFGGISDVRPLVGRADKGGTLAADELIAVARSAEGVTHLRKHLERHVEQCPLLHELGAAIGDLGHVYEPILDSFDEDGRLVDHASDALGPLRRKYARLQVELEKRLKGLVDEPRISKHLQDRYYTQREDRYVVPVRADARGYVKGIVHGTSGSGQTIFVEPAAIVDMNNRLKLAECDVADEERRIYAQLCGYVVEEATAIRAALDAATALDVIAAAAKLADELNAVPPAIDPDVGIRLVRARHPMLALSERHCVPNDIIVDSGHTLIISGPNAGGKTVALKTAGLLALMTRAGLHVPADDTTSLPWYRTIHSDIGDSQSIEMDLSTYSAHLQQLAGFVETADAHTLLLIDEISVGTEPEQGAAIAQAVLERLAERGVSVIVTTHYEQLKNLGASGGRFANASVGFDLEAMEPTFELHMGLPGSSGALHVARRMGLPESVTARAEELLGVERATIDEMLASISDERRRIAEERDAVAIQRAEADRALAEAEASRHAAKEKEAKLRKGAHGEAVEALRKARAELDRVRTSVKRRSKGDGKVVDAARAAARKVDDLSADVFRLQPERDLPPGREPRPEELEPGTPVIVASLGGRGEVVDRPHRGRVMVRVGSMRTAVAIGGVLIDVNRAGQRKAAPTASRSKNRKSRHKGAARRAPVELTEADTEGRALARTPDTTCDVRGERVDEAVDKLDRFIDQSLLGSRELVFVIHGHGTGALRTAVRQHVAQHVAVTEWRPGESGEGGDGVTIAWLDVD